MIYHIIICDAYTRWRTLHRPIFAMTLSNCAVLTIFTVRHVIQRTVLLSQFCPSVRPSVCLSDACIVTKLNDALRIF